MTDAMIDNDRRVYEAIVAYKKTHDGCSPTVREIQAATKLPSTSTVWRAMLRLRKSGHLEQRDNKWCMIGATWSPAPAFMEVKE